MKNSTIAKRRALARVMGPPGNTIGVKRTPHDGRFIVSWNPHTKAGILDLTSTQDPRQARVFSLVDLWEEYRTISLVEPVRPWDGEPNRPLTGINLAVEFIEEE